MWGRAWGVSIIFGSRVKGCPLFSDVSSLPLVPSPPPIFLAFPRPFPLSFSHHIYICTRAPFPSATSVHPSLISDFIAVRLDDMAAIRKLFEPRMASAVRGFGTSAKVMVSRPRASSSEATSASQPVFKKDAPPAPAPRRPTQPKRPEQPATDSPTARRGGKEGSVFASYKALPYNTKLVFWTCGASK